MNKLPRVLTLLLSIVGAAIAAYLTYTHFQVTADPDFSSICNVNETLNCDVVNSSKFSEVLGIPIALIGLAFYVTLAILSLLSMGKKQEGPRAPAVIWGLSFLSVFLSAGLAYISGAMLGAWCLFCISLYVVNLGLLGTSWWASGLTLKPLIKELDQELRVFYKSPLIYTTIAAFAGAVWVGDAAYYSHVSSTLEAARTARTAELQKEQQQSGKESSGDTEAPKSTPKKPSKPPVDIPLRGDEPFKGGVDAKVTIVEFADFECPYCSKAAFTLYDVAERFGDRIKIVYKHFPLDQSCNALSSPLHDYACNASFASICAGKQGKFWEFHKKAFSNQRDLTDEDLLKYATDLGLDIDTWETCLRSPETMATVQSDIDAAMRAKISGTPSVFINGQPEKSQAIIDADLMSIILEDALKRAN